LSARIAGTKSTSSTRIVAGGDYCDWIHWGDSRFDPEAVDANIAVKDMSSLAALLQIRLLEYLKPIRHQCIGAVMGNHEHQYMTANSQVFVHDEMCRALGVPNMRYTGWCDIYFVHIDGLEGVEILNGNESPPAFFTAKIRVLVSHGFGAAATAGGKINALKRLMDAAHNITDPADSPASADALRDDLVANTIPSIESALNSLGTKINNILAKLEAAEVVASS